MMDIDRFDALTRSLSGARCRRRALATLLGGTLGLLGLGDGLAEKGKGKKKPKKKLPLNTFSCVNVGQACRGNSANCCSGICLGNKPKKGKKDKSTCVAHNAGICTASSDVCSTGVNAVCNVSNPLCTCVLTTGNAGFCGDFTVGGDKLCRVCSRDTDCQAEFGPGAACLAYGGICAELCAATGGTACAPACV